MRQNRIAHSSMVARDSQYSEGSGINLSVFAKGETVFVSMIRN